ncbi:hypothetical protein LR48_Vigan08g126800 [Vigna angularis]|uniref:CBM-cenC domain-containing protein n=1 Tax=Phaseolus angularis TaxID=3914 RepID=A0A0L9V5Y6_PHAAN|nr:hypothetical protein LR48_Vigan08g126800 [Vigna angularis]
MVEIEEGRRPKEEDGLFPQLLARLQELQMRENASGCQKIIYVSVSYLAGDDNIIINPQFDDGLNNWSGRGCKIVLHDSMNDGKIVPKSRKFFASATECTQTWNGIQQDITRREQRKVIYEVTALVRIFGNNVSIPNVRATLWVQASNLKEQIVRVEHNPGKLSTYKNLL